MKYLDLKDPSMPKGGQGQLLYLGRNKYPIQFSKNQSRALTFLWTFQFVILGSRNGIIWLLVGALAKLGSSAAGFEEGEQYFLNSP